MWLNNDHITSITDLIKSNTEHIVRFKRKMDEIKLGMDKTEEAIRQYKRQKVNLTLDQLMACVVHEDIVRLQTAPPTMSKQQQQQQPAIEAKTNICNICADAIATHVHAINSGGTRGCGQWICEDCIHKNNDADTGGSCPYCRGEPPISHDGNSLWLKVATQ